MKAVSGIYKITCVVSGKAYIGKFKGIIEQRVMKHLNGKTPNCRAIHRAVKKYGKDNFTWDVLHENVIPELLPHYEIEEIKIHKTKTPHGYNLSDGGEGQTGFRHSEKTRRRLSEVQKGKVVSNETRRKQSLSLSGKNNPNYGKTMPDKQKRKISESLKGRTVSEEQLQKVRGRKLSAEHREKIRNASAGKNNPNYGKTMPDKQKRKISESLKGRTVSEEQLQKMKANPSRGMLGKKHTLQSRAKMSESLKGRVSPNKGKSLSESTKRKISESLKKNPLAIEAQKKATKAASKRNAGGFRNPNRDSAKAFYFALANGMPVSEKRRSLRAKFPDISKSTIDYWTRKWQSELI